MSCMIHASPIEFHYWLFAVAGQREPAVPLTLEQRLVGQADPFRPCRRWRVVKWRVRLFALISEANGRPQTIGRHATYKQQTSWQANDGPTTSSVDYLWKTIVDSTHIVQNTTQRSSPHQSHGWSSAERYTCTVFAGHIAGSLRTDLTLPHSRACMCDITFGGVDEALADMALSRRWQGEMAEGRWYRGAETGDMVQERWLGWWYSWGQ